MKKVALLAAVVIPALISTAAYAQDGYGYMAPGSGVGVNYETRLSGIEDQIRALTGKTEQLEYAVRTLDQRMQRFQSDYDTRIQKLETAPPPAAVPAPAPAPTPAATPAEEEEEPTVEPASKNGQLGDLKMRNGKVTSATKDTKSPALPAKPEDYGLTAQEQYDRAFSLLKQANYDAAEKAFKAFIEKNPKDAIIDNAKYWYGETFYVRAKFKEAAVAFADAYQQSPKGTKAGDALLKLGMSLGSLGNKDDACTAFASLKKSFPTAANLRSRADQERARLKCK